MQDYAKFNSASLVLFVCDLLENSMLYDLFNFCRFFYQKITEHGVIKMLISKTFPIPTDLAEICTSVDVELMHTVPTLNLGSISCVVFKLS